MPAHFAKYDSNHQPADLFHIVADVEKYPEFLPWISAVRIIEKHENHFLAELVVKFKSLSYKYTSRVEMIRPDEDHKEYRINVGLVSGPFKYLKTNWQFIPKENGTEIIFEMDFKFESILFEKMLGFLFEKAVVKMTNAFIKRADDILGTNIST
jgi:coenzyme Q-binding protein COQ10